METNKLIVYIQQEHILYIICNNYYIFINIITFIFVYYNNIYNLMI